MQTHRGPRSGVPKGEEECCGMGEWPSQADPLGPDHRRGWGAHALLSPLPQAPFFLRSCSVLVVSSWILPNCSHSVLSWSLRTGFTDCPIPSTHSPP